MRPSSYLSTLNQHDPNLQSLSPPTTTYSCTTTCFCIANIIISVDTAATASASTQVVFNHGLASLRVDAARIMAATQVARNASFSGFDDLVKMPSSPTLQPSSCARAASSSANNATASTSSVASPFNMRKVGLDENQPPPPPGSSPEVFFRYYLAVELRKAGTQPSEALLDRYVRNHFDSLFKNKAAQSTSAPSAAPVVPATTAPISASSSSSSSSSPQQQQQQTASTSEVTVAAVARQPAPLPRASALAAPSADSHLGTASPPELDTAESPALSGRSYSPVATPPALGTIDEHDAALVDFSTVFGEPSSSLLTAPSHAAGASQVIKFEDDSDQMLSFFRTSPFRTTQYESATIDPHVVEHGSLAQPTSLQSTLAMPLDSISPSQLAAVQANPFNAAAESSLKHEHHNRDDSAAPMSEDGMSEDDDDDDEHDGEHRRSKSSGMGQTLSTIPMAVGDTNYLKPDPEEYKKLSSKEKRQLRNKISARNFRTRRKEYINQLEDQIADRDALIAGLRQQISQLSVENKSLKDEVRTIKARTISSQDVGKILEALQTMTSTANNPTAAAAGNGGALNSPRPSLLRRSSPSLMPQANTKKDVAPSSSFWGGVGSVNATNTFMPVC
ncbi:hypothetical protein PANT_1c00019 [Moesziomyces antarcticus T-34]|uniref:BZIP domain-containing protein n=1 Tax=Pseudozyma antarctica (strain T-34) TaxID=1151754 RepID=M9LIT2_PSEA3|nr:hypothetical protein PANT_1c00019 [Moesziomyces antarcticus T-34]